MMKRIIKFVSFALLIIFFTTCEKKDITPTYIKISKDDISILLTNLDLTQFNSPSGLTAHDFSDIWLTANGKKLGVWELPCKIPILDDGPITLEITPGIKLNGMSTTRPMYPFIQKYTTTIDVQKGDKVQIEPKFEYYEKGVAFPLVENFESAGTIFASSDSTKEGFVKIYDPELIYHNLYDPNDENTCSGLIQLQDSVRSFEVISNQLALPGGGTPVFLEFNYNCDQEIKISLLVYTSTAIPVEEVLVVLKPTEDKWKKTYINLTLAVSRNYTATAFKVILAGNKNNSSQAKFYFDNIRVISKQ